MIDVFRLVIRRRGWRIGLFAMSLTKCGPIACTHPSFFIDASLSQDVIVSEARHTTFELEAITKVTCLRVVSLLGSSAPAADRCHHMLVA
jgi:hypothetical protein